MTKSQKLFYSNSIKYPIRLSNYWNKIFQQKVYLVEKN